MNVTVNKKDELNLELALAITVDDYAADYKKRITEFRKKAEIKGFRKGMVPASLVQKMYGGQALVDSINDTISHKLHEYIQENDLHVLGEPLPQEEQASHVWEYGKDFEFKFDVALYPEVNIELSKDNTITRYDIKASDEAKAELKANMLRQYGSLENGEAAGEDDFIIADFVQGENKVEGTYVALRSVAEPVKASMVGLKAGDSIVVNVNEAFTNETDRAAMLKIDKAQLAEMDPEWNMNVVTVKTFVSAELNQETYDKIFGEGVVKSEEEFDAKVTERVAYEYKQESDWKVNEDLKKYLVDMAALTLPEEFMKRWLFVSHDGKFTMEDIEKEWDLFAADFKWQLVREAMLKKYDVKIEEADIMEAAKHFAAYQFSMYGMNNVPEEQLEGFAKNLLAQEKESRRILESVEDVKALEAVKNAITLESKEISLEDFRNLK